MNIFRIERGNYLFRPGDPNSTIYIVAEGLLEISITVNEKHLHLLKKSSGVKDIEHSPKIPKRKTQIIDYPLYCYFDINKAEGLKKKTEIVPIENEYSIIGCIGLQEDPPESTHTIGDYPQEFVIDYIGQGGLLYPHTALVQDIHMLQCKAVQPTTIYALKADFIEEKAKKYEQLKYEIQLIKEELGQNYNYLDHFILNESDPNVLRRIFKGAVIRQIMNKREERRKGENQFASLVPKIRAVIACEEAMNFELADKVIKGELPPHYVSEDGNLNPAAMSSSQKSTLPRTHPIMKVFKSIFDSIETPQGSIMNQFNQIETSIQEQNLELEQFCDQISIIQQKLEQLKHSDVLKSYDHLPPIHQKRISSFTQQSLEIPKLDIEKINKITEERRNKRRNKRQNKQKRSLSANRIDGSTNLLEVIKKSKFQQDG